MPLPNSIHLFRRRDAWFAIAAMLFTALIVSIGLGASKQTVVLSSMSAGAIAAVVWMFRDWRRQASFWLTGFSFTVLHVAAIYFAQPSWVPTPTILLAPLFLLDFVFMAWVFPARGEPTTEADAQPSTR